MDPDANTQAYGLPKRYQVEATQAEIEALHHLAANTNRLVYEAPGSPERAGSALIEAFLDRAAHELNRQVEADREADERTSRDAEIVAAVAQAVSERDAARAVCEYSQANVRKLIAEAKSLRAQLREQRKVVEEYRAATRAKGG